MPGRLSDKIILVSGGARGMGAAEAKCCADEGARVVVGDVLEAEGRALAKELGDACAFVPLDVTREDAWQHAVATALERFGRLDGLVNNAGILRTGSIEKTSLEEFEAVVRVNQVGCFLGMKHAIPALRRSGGGSIVNISSIAGMQGVAGVPAYVASKFAVRGLTKAAALELGRDGIRVNSVHPGGVETPMTGGEQLDRVDHDAVYASQPLPRIGQPEEVALLVVYLLSDESAYCTGSEFVIDGGATAGQTHAGLGD